MEIVSSLPLPRLFCFYPRGDRGVKWQENILWLTMMSIVSAEVDAAGGSSRRDVHLARYNSFVTQAGAGAKRYFDDVYGTRQMFLKSLMTLQTYTRRGHGVSLLKWGQDLVRKMDEESVVPITLRASPQGRGLYRKMGFEEKGEISVKNEGEERVLLVTPMVWVREAEASGNVK